MTKSIRRGLACAAILFIGSYMLLHAAINGLLRIFAHRKAAV